MGAAGSGLAATRVATGFEGPLLAAGFVLDLVAATGFGAAICFSTLAAAAAGRGVAMVRVVMVNPVEGAEYFVNGRRVKEADLLGEKGMEIPAGENVVVVQQQGFGKVTRTVHVAAGGTEMVRVDLKSGGRLAVTSTPAGGQILLDGLPVGMTRASSDDVVPGPHVVEVRLDGYRLFSQQVNVQAGTVTSVQADLQPAAPPPPASRRRR